MPPTWLSVVAWMSLIAAGLSALDILIDIYGRRYRQHMGIMEAVWPVTALYFGPLTSWAYRRWGRPRSNRWLEENRRDAPPSTSRRVSVALGVSHCGAGCTLGDIAAATGVFLAGATLAGHMVFAEMAASYVAAVVLGVLFQYFAIAPMRGLGLWSGLREATKADVLSLTAFEVGLFGWMAVMAFVLFPEPNTLHPDTAAYWFLMQVGMVIGFATAWPANVWLIRRGIKEAM
jgi:hypothetical protein